VVMPVDAWVSCSNVLSLSSRTLPLDGDSVANVIRRESSKYVVPFISLVVSRI